MSLALEKIHAVTFFICLCDCMATTHTVTKGHKWYAIRVKHWDAVFKVAGSFRLVQPLCRKFMEMWSDEVKHNNYCFSAQYCNNWCSLWPLMLRRAASKLNTYLLAIWGVQRSTLILLTAFNLTLLWLCVAETEKNKQLIMKHYCL